LHQSQAEQAQIPCLIKTKSGKELDEIKFCEH